MLVIYLTPKAKYFNPHIWDEGGLFNNKDSAEFQAKQIRKMRDKYKQVTVIPNPVKPKK